MKVVCASLLFVVLAAGALAQKKLDVVATLPDYAAIAQAIGGERIAVTALARGTEDPHFIDAKPSFIRVLNKADLLIESGAELELGWLPSLVAQARNKAIVPNGNGNVMLARHVKLIDVPDGPIDRSMGDVHPTGNPHFTLDPVIGKTIANVIADKLAALEPAHAAFFRANQQKFVQEIDRKLVEWKKALEPLRGAKVITYHKSFDYFLNRFGLELAGTIEPKPGIEPSPTHISALIPAARARGVTCVIIEPNRRRRTASYLADSIGAKVIVLPGMVGGVDAAKTYIALFDYIVAQLTRAS